MSCTQLEHNYLPCYSALPLGTVLVQRHALCKHYPKHELRGEQIIPIPCETLTHDFGSEDTKGLNLGVHICMEIPAIPPY